jgi:hypothetical protein
MADEETKSDFNLTFSALRVVMSPSDHYLDADWRTILFAPLWVFEAVATADGPADEKQRAAFTRILDQPPAGVFPAFVFANVRRNQKALDATRAADPRSPLVGLADVETLLRGYPNPDEAVEFRRALVDVGRQVADASGGGWLGRGSKVTDAEAAVLAQLATIFHVS